MSIKSNFVLGVTGLAALVALSACFGSVYTVDQSERGVVLRNGRIVDTAEPGLHFKWPFVMDVAKISVQTHKAQYPHLTSYSFDQQPAVVTVSVNYSIDPARVAEVYATSKNLETLVSRILNSQVPQQTENTFGQYTAVKMVQNREVFVADLNRNLRAALDTMKSPLIIESVNVENVDFSKKYEESVELNMQAEVAINTRRQNLETEKVNAEIVRTTAQGAADAKLAGAKAEAEAIALKGNAEAAILAAKGKALHDNPELVSLMAVEKWHGDLPTQMVPGSAVPFVNLNGVH